MMKVEIPMNEIPEKVRELLNAHKGEIEQAWTKREDGEDLSISLSAKLSIKEGNNICEVIMSFTKEKVKDKRSFGWDEKQQNLFDNKKEAEGSGQGEKNIPEEGTEKEKEEKSKKMKKEKGSGVNPFGNKGEGEKDF